MDLPKDVIFKATLKPGGVFLYKDEIFPEKAHFFAVINPCIVYGQPLLLVCASSQISKRKEYVKRMGIDINTLVIVQPSECSFLTKETVFDCNRVLVRPIEVLKEKMDIDKIIRYTEIKDDLLTKLREAVKRSPMISPKIKKQLE